MSGVSFRPVWGPPPNVSEQSRQLGGKSFDDAKPEPTGLVRGRTPDGA
jgi:hypothetical protein